LNQSTDSIVVYLEALYANRNLIADAYNHGGVVMAEENQRKIRQLQQHRALIPYIHEEFRLNSSLSRHLDELFQRQRNYAVGTNFGEQINRLPRLIDEYLKASHENRLEDRDIYATDFDVGVFELREGIISTLLLLRTLTDNRFANVSTIAEKQRQNEYYVSKVEQLGNALASLQAETLLEQLSSSSLLEPLYSLYRHQIIDRLPEWRATVMDITAILKAYLYRLRQIEPEARRLRTFALFLNKNPEYQPPEAEDLLNLPEWGSIYSGLWLKAHPDLSSSQVTEALVDIAQRIPPAKLTILQERATGRLSGANDGNLVVIIKPKQVQVAFYRYVEAASGSANPLSALQWKRQQAIFNKLDDEAWLIYVQHLVQMMGNGTKSRLHGMNVERREMLPSHSRSGNLIINDIVLWKKI
jgi:hypothetical protein